MLEFTNVTKQYKTVTALNGISFTAEPGKVTAFLGPNGAGKTTALRILLGLETHYSGAALVNGKPYRTYRAPLWTIGAQIDGAGAHKKRTATTHLRWVAQANGIHRARIADVLKLVGLDDAARRRVGAFSVGMGQRLGIAMALLGDPPILVLDEPTNGLDPDGILWLRGLVRGLADEGRTVLLSSHLLSEVSQVADQLVVINHGRIVENGPTTKLLSCHEGLESAYFAWTRTSGEGVAP